MERSILEDYYREEQSTPKTPKAKLSTTLTGEIKRGNTALLVVRTGDVGDDENSRYFEFEIPDKRRRMRAEWPNQTQGHKVARQKGFTFKLIIDNSPPCKMVYKNNLVYYEESHPARFTRAALSVFWERFQELGMIRDGEVSPVAAGVAVEALRLLDTSNTLGCIADAAGAGAGIGGLIGGIFGGLPGAGAGAAVGGAFGTGFGLGFCVLGETIEKDPDSPESPEEEPTDAGPGSGPPLLNTKSVHMTLAQRGSSMIHRTSPYTRISRSPRHAHKYLRRDSPGGTRPDAGRAAACAVRLSASPEASPQIFYR
jgi:hypothetical protein